MNDQNSKPTEKSAAKQKKQERLNQALRDNLKRRKAQARKIGSNEDKEKK